ncbi:alpha/beta hydrolase [Pseudoalteromonas luteoviolacea]|uniref:alpha/beta hydrolase n=1 Tax=Pseudoalteromonas luteoviolacea TaxID=43657 RepID=UPI001F339E12|nr:alpha/beta hydrolase [Pseudoalteromonas luteoviolacea]MCF6439852.1 alpha/beta hydrolase [Pseudoalteromonas luteoviolacea]
MLNQKLDNLTLASLRRFLPETLPREFKLCSSNRYFYALYDEDTFKVLTNRGEHSFDLYELLELLSDVLVLESTKPKPYMDAHKHVSYKLPIILWLLEVSDENAFEIPFKMVEHAFRSELEVATGFDSIEGIRELHRQKVLDEVSFKLPSDNTYAEDAKVIKRKDYNKVELGTELPEEEQRDNTLVSVKYATTRQLLNTEPKQYINQISESVNYGTAQLSIPVDHVSGRIERPSIFEKALSIFGIEAEKKSKHVMIRDLQPMEERDFLSDFNDSDSAFIFIHGYNVPFKSALYHSAQLKFDLAYKGEFVLFSWPSFGSLKSYAGDKERAVGAGEHLAKLIEDISHSEVKTIYILAHSMGSYCLSEAIKYLAKSDPSVQPKLRIALAAPDIDRDAFKKQYADRYLSSSDGVSIYACEKDKALMMSRLVNSSDRLGFSDPITVVDGMDTIDASPLAKKWLNKVRLNHSYIFQHNYLITDLYDYFFYGKPASQRRLKPMLLDEQRYWQLHPC